MYEQVGGAYTSLVKGIIDHGHAMLWLSFYDGRDSVYNALHGRLVKTQKLPDTLTVDRYPDADKFIKGYDGKRYAYIITFKTYENNREAAKKLLSKEWYYE